MKGNIPSSIHLPINCSFHRYLRCHFQTIILSQFLNKFLPIKMDAILYQPLSISVLSLETSVPISFPILFPFFLITWVGYVSCYGHASSCIWIPCFLRSCIIATPYFSIDLYLNFTNALLSQTLNFQTF